MDDREAGRYWDDNAAVWTSLSRQGWNVYHDLLNAPAFQAMLPDVAGLRGLDIGCGEAADTRAMAARGARMCSLDISPTFIRAARATEPELIRYVIGSGQSLPYRDASFDFATACMSLMDMPDPDLALREACRVLKPGGFFQFSITHPCFDTAHRRLLRDLNRRAYAVEIARYFDNTHGEIDEWLFAAAPAEAKQGLRKFRVPMFRRTLSEWLNGIVASGLLIEEVREPRVNEETAAKFPAVADTRIVSYFLHIRCRKPVGLPFDHGRGVVNPS